MNRFDLQILEPFWLGVAVWILGFTLYLYGAHWRRNYTAARIGTILCWLGFAITAFPLIKDYSLPPFDWPRSFDIRSLTPEQIYAVIRIAWLFGFGILITSWVRIVPAYIGWAGFTIGMTATVASSTSEPQLQGAVAAAGFILLLLLLASRYSGSKRAARPGDYEAELLRLCYGDIAVASRLIKFELKQHPNFSRQAAAMSAVTRLKRDRR